MVIAVKRATVRLKPAETFYFVDGDELSRAIESSGLTRAQLCEKIGWAPQSRISHITRAGRRVKLSGETVQKIAKVLRRYGVTFEGLVN